MSKIRAHYPMVYVAGFRAWGHEMNKDTTPIETGLMPFVRMKKKVIDHKDVDNILDQIFKRKM